MTAALLPRSLYLQRLLVVDPTTGDVEDAQFTELSRFVGPGDVLVVNDAGTLPASLPVRFGELELELRLAGPVEEGWAVLFGEGSWRERTEDRAAPPRLEVGDVLELDGRRVPVLEVSTTSPRLIRVSLTLEEVLSNGVPVQYSYVPRDLRLDEVQTPYAGRPWATEMPSAGRVLTPELMEKLRAAGAEVHALTHAAGLSATGDSALDAALPLPEPYEVPEETWAAVQRADRVIAVGTSVVRALESAARGELSGVAEMVIGPDTELRVVDGLLSGMHEPGESHFQMMAAFLPLERLRGAVRHAEREGYRNHEFGDSTLLLPG